VVSVIVAVIDGFKVEAGEECSNENGYCCGISKGFRTPKSDNGVDHLVGCSLYISGEKAGRDRCLLADWRGLER